MEKVTVLSDEEVRKKYPQNSSHIAKIVHDTINSGLRVAVIESTSFFGDFNRVVGICTSTIESQSCFNRMKYVIDFNCEKRKAVIAFDDKCNT